MSPRELSLLFVRTIAAWCVLSTVGFYLGQATLSPFLPFLGALTDLLAPHYVPTLSIVEREGSLTVQASALVVMPRQITPDEILNQGARITAGIHLYHALVPAVILYTALFAWPMRTLRDRLLLLTIGIPMLLLVLSATIPFLLGSQIETLLIDHAARAGIRVEAPFVVHWAMLLELGGLWGIPLIGSALCVGFLNGAKGRVKALHEQFLLRQRYRRMGLG